MRCNVTCIGRTHIGYTFRAEFRMIEFANDRLPMELAMLVALADAMVCFGDAGAPEQSMSPLEQDLLNLEVADKMAKDNSFCCSHQQQSCYCDCFYRDSHLCFCCCFRPRETPSPQQGKFTLCLIALIVRRREARRRTRIFAPANAAACALHFRMTLRF